MIANIEAERFNQISGSIEGITLFNKKHAQRYLIADDLSASPLNFEVEILTDNQVCVDNLRRREIERWLFNKGRYEKFYIDMADDMYGDTFEYCENQIKRLYLNCRFINPVKLEYNGGIVGYRATLEADSNMWWQDTTVQTFLLNHTSVSNSSMVTVSLNTDARDFTYPKVTLQMGGTGGDIIISNYTDASTRPTRFSGLSSNTIVILNGNNNYISGQNYEKFYKQNFPRLLDGDNRIYIEGNISSIKFEFNNRRYFV